MSEQQGAGEVQRYKLFYEKMILATDGPWENRWVKAEDYAALRARLEAAEKERGEAVALLREALPEIRPGKSCPCSACHHLRVMKSRIGALVGREVPESPPQS